MDLACEQTNCFVESQAKEKPMIDLVFGVHDARAWHAANLSRNPSHYSFVGRIAGAGAVNWVQRTSAPRIYYNTLVPFGGQVRPLIPHISSMFDSTQPLLAIIR
jgi:hypothetical protein